MKIVVRYWVNKEEFKTLELDIHLDEHASFHDVAQHVSKILSQEILLLPTLVKPARNSQTVSEYIQKHSQNVHFNAFNRALLNEQEQKTLENLLLQNKNTLKDIQDWMEWLTIALPKDVQEALVVRFTNENNMFGRTVKNNIDDPHTVDRYSVQIHPYPWIAAGASNVIVYRNTFNKLFVTLVYNQRRDKRPQTDPLRQQGVPDYFKLPEGYMHPKPCAGGEKGIALIDSDAMDEAEELLLRNISMKEAYKTVKEKYSNRLKTHETPASYDKTLKECAARESDEEVGYNPSSLQEIQLISQREDNNAVPTIANLYLIKARQRNNITLPPLMVDGIEIKEAMWGKVSAFRFEQDEKKAEKIRVVLDYYDEAGDVYPVEVPFRYALMIGQAIKKLREEEIQKISTVEEVPLFTARENVEARLKQVLKVRSLNKFQKGLEDILGASPEAFLSTKGVDSLPGESAQEKSDNLKALATLGKSAEDYHKKIIALAVVFKNTPLDKPLNAEQLITAIREEPEIEADLSYSKARWFALAKPDSELAPSDPNERNNVKVPRTYLQ